MDEGRRKGEKVGGRRGDRVVGVQVRVEASVKGRRGRGGQTTPHTIPLTYSERSKERSPKSLGTNGGVFCFS